MKQPSLPVPGTGKVRGGRGHCFRKPKTQGIIRALAALCEDQREFRQIRRTKDARSKSGKRLPSAWDDISVDKAKHKK